MTIAGYTLARRVGNWFIIFGTLSGLAVFVADVQLGGFLLICMTLLLVAGLVFRKMADLMETELQKISKGASE